MPEALCQKVYLGDLGGSKSKFALNQSCLGLLTTIQLGTCSGEKRLLGSARLFTEVYFDGSKSAVVLDDPVSSLSHARRKIVAMRIAEIAGERQVVVFTHDLTFLGYLITAAENKHVPITERCIERTGGSIPGRVLDIYPWKAKDAKLRFDDLRNTLHELRERGTVWGQEEYLRATSEWAGDLSETYSEYFARTLPIPLLIAQPPK